MFGYTKFCKMNVKFIEKARQKLNPKISLALCIFSIFLSLTSVGQTDTTTNSFGCVSGDCNNGNGTFIDSLGNIYTGEWKDGTKNGHGTYTQKRRGEKYIGEWKDGKKNGKGEFTRNAYKYVGQWKDDKKNGQGTSESTMKSVNKEGNVEVVEGTKYVGEWKDDKYNGQGELTEGALIHSRDDYKGEWKNGEKNGQGISTWKDGRKYEGGWKDGNRDGQGTFTYANGDKYIGEWKNGDKNGKGEFIYANGSVYVGEWKDDKPIEVKTKTGCIAGNCINGQGTYLFPNGEKYVGSFKDGKYSGQGSIIFANGQQYIGNWENDFQSGQGTITWPNGQKFVGTFKNGKREGFGIETLSDGKVLSGEWENDEFIGEKKNIPVVATPAKIVEKTPELKFYINGESYVDFLKRNRFDCYIKQGYSSTLIFYPTNEVQGVVNFTMFSIKSNGSWEVVTNQEYPYRADNTKEKGKLYFISSMQGEIYIQNDGSLIMNDVSRKEKYYFTSGKK